MKEPYPNVPKEEQEKYVRDGFWTKIKKVGANIPFVTDAVAMYYCAIDSKTSLVAKGIAFAALAYFILPVDLVADLLPIVGYTDDAGVIAAAIASLGSQILDEHKSKAKKFLSSDKS